MSAVEAEAIARRYFDAIGARDGAAIRELFADDAELRTAVGAVQGREAIADFYERTAFGFEDLEPTPGPFLADESGRVAVEISLRMGGSESAVADFFEVRNGRIDRLRVYLLPRS